METTSTQFYISVLSIAGSDPSGGAGIQQDIKVCEALGCYGMAAITALTAQSPTHVTAVFNITRFLEMQLTALLDEVSPNAVKVGMMPDVTSVEVIANTIKSYRLKNIVVDPVMASTSGHLLSQKSAVEAMKKLLFPLATVITPNIPEAEILTGLKIPSIEEAKSAAKSIAQNHDCTAVLLKGGHSKTMEDILYLGETDRFLILPTKRIITPNIHGTGCRLSTAISCGLAKGLDIIEAIITAKEWLTGDLQTNSNMTFPKVISDPLGELT